MDSTTRAASSMATATCATGGPPTDGAEFDKRAACVANEYSSFTAVDDVKLNGRLTLGENTADNGGLRIALMALQDTLKGKGEKLDGFTPGAAILPGIRPDLVREHRAAGSPRPRHDGSALARPLSRQRHPAEHAGIPKGILLQGRAAHGQRRTPAASGKSGMLQETGREACPTCAAGPSPCGWLVTAASVVALFACA